MLLREHAKGAQRSRARSCHWEISSVVGGCYVHEKKKAKVLKTVLSGRVMVFDTIRVDKVNYRV